MAQGAHHSAGLSIHRWLNSGVGWKGKEAKAQGKRIKTAMAIALHIVADEEVEKGQLLHVAARDELEAGWRRQDGAWVGVHIPTEGEEETGKMMGKVRQRQ